MRTLLVVFLVSFLFFFGLAEAEQQPKADKPLTKEQIEQLESLDTLLESFEDLKRTGEAMTKTRGNDCIKSFGHEEFCSCLNKNMAIGLSFREYIVVTTSTKEELGYESLSGDIKKLVNSALSVREQCVKVIHEK
jgi:hypothetical protein